MKVTRDVINDLLPAYFSGDASEDTRQLIEEYFRSDAAFEREARKDAEGLQSLRRLEPLPPESQLEKTALKRAKRLLRVRALLLALASTFSLNAISLGFSFEIANGHTHMHWLAIPGQGRVVAVILFLALSSWVLYFGVRRRVRTRVLG